jgi:DNA mismatch endonuclease (patch repair protein)
LPRTSKVEDQFAEALDNEGHSFERNVRDLPGSPDIVFNDKQLVIFFNGCWFHAHDCNMMSKPNYSMELIQNDNKIRDAAIRQKLQAKGFDTLVVWECEWKKNPERVLRHVKGRLHFAQPQTTDL